MEAHRRQREQRMIDAVVGQDGERMLRAQTLRQNPERMGFDISHDNARGADAGENI
jgi:hypothetical protein